MIGCILEVKIVVGSHELWHDLIWPCLDEVLTRLEYGR